MKLHEIVPSGIIDSNENLWGTYQLAVPVLGLSEAISKGIAAVVISAPKYESDIRKLLLKKISLNKIYTFEAEIYCTFIHNVENYKNYLLKNWTRIERFYTSLSDIYSKNTFECFIKGRCSADLRYFQEACEYNQYYPKDIIKFSDSEIFVELGSFDGETLVQWLNLVNRKYKKVYCFEPDNTSLEKLRIVKEKEETDKIEIIPKAANDIKTTLSFQISEGTGTSCVSASNGKTVSIDADTVDNCITEKITYMKMDIEGSELKALRGSEKHLKNDKPVLAICIYHNPEDFLEIMEYLQELDLGYKFYLRHHNCSATETVLYCIP